MNILRPISIVICLALPAASAFAQVKLLPPERVGESRTPPVRGSAGPGSHKLLHCYRPHQVRAPARIRDVL